MTEETRRLYSRPRRSTVPVTSSTAGMAAGKAGNNHVKDGDNAGDDGLKDCADAVDDGHETATDGAQDGLDLECMICQHTYSAIRSS